MGHLLAFDIMKDHIVGSNCHDLHSVLVDYIETFVIPGDIECRKINKKIFKTYKAI